MSKSTDSSLPRLFDSIISIIPVEDADPYKASILQGFERSLLKNSWLIQLVNALPSTISELAPDLQEVRLPRRISGQCPIKWYAQSHKALSSMITPIFRPFLLFILGQEQDIRKYQSWIDAHPFPLTVLAKDGGTFTYEDFSLDALRCSFLKICDSLDGKVHSGDVLEARKHLSQWVEPQGRGLGYKVGGHYATYPNISALEVAGFRDNLYGRFEKINQGLAPYVEEIVKTTKSVIQERNCIGERLANQYFRKPPGLNLFTPAIYPHFRELPIANAPLSKNDKKRFHEMCRAFYRQRGYAFEIESASQAKAILGIAPNQGPDPHFLIHERTTEIKLATECVATLAASEISAVIRLPNAINRTAGSVRQLANLYRAGSVKKSKLIRSFRAVQDQITSSIPLDFIPFIESAESGIRIIADAHIEWMNIKGLPLCVQKDVTRIPVTPGNLFIEQVLSKIYIHLSQASFHEVLILSALREDDPISNFLSIAIKTFLPHLDGKVRIRTERVAKESEMIDALNSFGGAMVIFDGHGKHEPNQPAKLQLIEEDIDIWQLRYKEVRMPPIVVLSSCDTHAADRNHASTANGFLSLGARTVLGSVFPINAMDASSFIARLLYRIVEFIPSAHKLFGRSLTWMEIMSGMIRMQLLTDFLRRLLNKRIIDLQIYESVHMEGNTKINLGEDWPFEFVVSKLIDVGIDEQIVRKELYEAAISSTAISYLQLGRPETIIVHPDKSA
ncbi:MAG: hypothetical protein EYC62_01075 [Alphaproteobacteria bacterium]|nr:MAG: hypothetical protein EYC62_01075 [Alphaproteobacteria bacterium]